MIELTASDGHKFSAYRADPSGDPKGAVVVLQDVFGVNPHIQKTADKFAAEGYVVIAPSLFDRVKPGVALGNDEAARAEGAELAKQIDVDVALADIQAAVEAVSSAGKVAVVGYGSGGYLAYVAANRVPGLSCAIGYYASGVETDFCEKRKIPTLLPSHNAEAAAAALERTQFWISQFVVGQPPIQLKNAGSYAQAKTKKSKKKEGGDDLGPPPA
jgi:carboxymethylenebutenolidase